MPEKYARLAQAIADQRHDQIVFLEPRAQVGVADVVEIRQLLCRCEQVRQVDERTEEFVFQLQALMGGRRRRQPANVELDEDLQRGREIETMSGEQPLE